MKKTRASLIPAITPKPWKKRYGYQICHHAENGALPVCEVLRNNPRGRVNGEILAMMEAQTQANSSAICAVPEILDACASVMLDPGYESLSPETRAEVERALSIARGEPQ